MKIRLDIPNKVQAKLLKKAHHEGISVDDLIVRSIKATLKEEKPVRSRKPPVIESERPGSLHLDNAKIFDLIDFP